MVEWLWAFLYPKGRSGLATRLRTKLSTGLVFGLEAVFLDYLPGKGLSPRFGVHAQFLNLELDLVCVGMVHKLTSWICLVST
jgi:hypothetical protein